jgi:hypothetical protein
MLVCSGYKENQHFQDMREASVHSYIVSHYLSPSGPSTRASAMGMDDEPTNKYE